MAMPVTVPRYTIADLESFPEDGNRYELLDGVLLVTRGRAPLHQRIVSRLFGQLDAYLRPDGVAEVFSPGSVEIEPKLHLEPDLLVIPTRELDQGVGLETRWASFRQWWLAVEVSGEGSEIYDRDHKGPAYLGVGVQEFWRVDLRDQCIYVSRPEGSPEQPHRERLTWLAPGRSNPLVISVADLFA